MSALSHAKVEFTSTNNLAVVWAAATEIRFTSPEQETEDNRLQVLQAIQAQIKQQVNASPSP
jgi:hypothetical protein